MTAAINNQIPSFRALDFELSDMELLAFKNFLEGSCGLVLATNKKDLVKSRLSKLFPNNQFLSISNFIKALKKGEVSQDFISKIIDLMTMHETFWFREKAQFEALKKEIIPSLVRKRIKRPKIWCAGCSSGQEPYSVAIVFRESLQISTLFRDLDFNIIGTDISESVLQQARLAKYSDFTLSRGLDYYRKYKYFSPGSEQWMLNEEVTRSVRFEYLNLQQSFERLGKFDVIFCRNVLIYFSEQLKQDILVRMAASLNSGGYLFLSSSERLPKELDQFIARNHAGSRYYQMKK